MEPLIKTEPLDIAGKTGDDLLLIAGPCSAETEEQTLEAARELSGNLGVKAFRAGLWKPRTRPGAFEGVGSAGFPWLEESTGRDRYEIRNRGRNSTPRIQKALKFGTDIVWIGARTAANPFAVQEIAEALKGVNIPVFIKESGQPRH
ncbi:MAG: hypothetical protein MZV63_57275 [Marinilabiliales bacterium]|nr:hypothetical protein [Marinilabiliales bacterium]